MLVAIPTRFSHVNLTKQWIMQTKPYYQAYEVFVYVYEYVQVVGNNQLVDKYQMG